VSYSGVLWKDALKIRGKRKAEVMESKPAEIVEDEIKIELTSPALKTTINPIDHQERVKSEPEVTFTTINNRKLKKSTKGQRSNRVEKRAPLCYHNKSS
jgi:hypothetical protein